MPKYKVAVVGCGGIGVQHAQGVVGLNNAELVAGCDISQDTLNAFKAKWERHWPNLSLYTDYRAMLEKERPDIVTVATPDNRHTDLVVDAASAGVKGIFCEKPLATSLTDADQMLAACESNDVILSIDHTRRFTPLWRYMKHDVIAGGKIGELQYIDGRSSGNRASLFRNGTHLIDALYYLADAEPAWVFAALENGYEDYTEYRGDGGRTPELEPSATGYVHFKNGVRSLYTGTSKNTAGPKWRFEIIGSEGYITVDKDAVLYVGKTAEVIAPPVWEISGIPYGVRELIEAVETGSDVASPGRAAHTVVEIICGFLESQRQGNAKVMLPLPRS